MCLNTQGISEDPRGHALFQGLKSLGYGWPEGWAWGRKRAKLLFERAIRMPADSSMPFSVPRQLTRDFQRKDDNKEFS